MDRRFHILFAVVMIVAAQVACIPSQDCDSVAIDIQGKVVDQFGQGIPSARVRILNEEFTKIDMTLITDADGAFEYQNLIVFRCETLTITVSAAGFTNETLQFHVYAGLTDSLPEFLTLTLTSAIP